MQGSTSIRVAISTRDAVRALATSDNVSLDEEVKRLAKAERQRRIGSELAAPVSAEDEQWIDASIASATSHASR